MKLYVFALLALVAVATASMDDLPPGYASPTELATVLASEPEAASQARFQQTSGDVISFGDKGTSSSTGATGGDAEEGDESTSEFDAQIDNVKKEIGELKNAIKESEECARRLSEQKAQLRNLQDQMDHLEKEKERKILEEKLGKQMKDLSEINRMSRSLRQKYNELKHTQNLIRSRMSGTRSSLNQLESEGDYDPSSTEDASKNIASEMKAMHAAQAKILAASHAVNTRTVKSHLKSANNAHKEVLDEEKQQEKEGF